MRYNATENNRPDFLIAAVRNADTSGTQNTGNAINRGTPLILNLSSTAQPTTSNDGHPAGYEDGLQVVLPSTGGGSPSLLYGVALSSIAGNQIGESMVFGVCSAVVEIVLTRTSTTSVWASYASINSGFMLTVDSANNAFGTYSSIAPSNLQPQALLLDSIASFTTNASTIGVSSLTSYASTILARVFVRMM